MTLRFLAPMLSLFAIPAIVGTLAVTQLVSLDSFSTTPPKSSTHPSLGLPVAAQLQDAPNDLHATTTATPIAIQTEQERYNTTLSQIQDGDWLAQQGQFQAAKSAYHQALSQNGNADLAATATDRLDQLPQKLAVKLPVKLPVKPTVKLAAKPVIELAVRPIRQPIHPLAIHPTAHPNPIARPADSHLFPPLQSPSPTALPLESSRFPKNQPSAQPIETESPTELTQWDPEPSAQLN